MGNSLFDQLSKLIDFAGWMRKNQPDLPPILAPVRGDREASSEHPVGNVVTTTPTENVPQHQVGRFQFHLYKDSFVRFDTCTGKSEIYMPDNLEWIELI